MRRNLRFLACCAWLALSAGAAWGQEVPAEALQQLDQLVGSRVESFAILGTQARRGDYRSCARRRTGRNACSKT
jgi:hypothetical protein